MGKFEDDLVFLNDGDKLIGREKEAEEVLYRISSNNMLVIEGAKGVGKTALLKYAIDNFKGKGKVIYVDIGTFGKRFDVGSLFNKNSRDMILLVDNVQYLSRENNKKIKYFYDQDYVRSVIFTTTSYSSAEFTDAIRSRIGRNVLKLNKVKKKDALDIVKSRLKDEDAISKDVFDRLYKESKSLRELLMSCNLLCEYLEVNGKLVADLKDVDKIKSEVVEGEVDVCLECNKKLVNVRGRWRCDNCDSFCDECGAFLEEEDFKCPECGAVVDEEEEE